jgi:hypothetical protein
VALGEVLLVNKHLQLRGHIHGLRLVVSTQFVLYVLVVEALVQKDQLMELVEAVEL